MKKIMMLLAMAAMTATGVNAQDNLNANCGVKEKVVCKKGDADCYKTDNAVNFPVCKGTHGYYVCCKAEKKAKPINTVYNNTEPLAFFQFVNYMPERAPVNTTHYQTQEKKLATVCRKSPVTGEDACYKTEYAQNFKVCKGPNGYYVCSR